MKKVLTLILIFSTKFIFAQSTEDINYQIVAKDSNNEIVSSALIGVKINILKASPTGEAVYIETQKQKTNFKGVVNLKIGHGTILSGNLKSINWDNDKYFIKTEIDPKGGDAYSVLDPVRLLSMPKVKRVKKKASSVYKLNTFYPELGGFVIQVSDGGRHGVVVAMQDQGVSNWFKTKELIENRENFDKNGAKFHDWRLPTKSELNLMYLAKSSIGNFSTNAYWSSSKSYKNYVWIQFFYFGNRAVYYKLFSNHIRAVRSF